MREEECGQITVFLGLLFITFFFVLSVCVEGIYVHMQSAAAVEAQMTAGAVAKANYHKELLEQFHIFAMDSRYVKKMDVLLKKNWEQNAGQEAIAWKTGDRVAITQKEGELLKKQIKAYMKYAKAAEIATDLKKTLGGVQENAKTDSLKQRLEEQTEEKGETSSKEENKEDDKKKGEGTKGEVKKEDPRKGLKKLLSKGILSVVMPEGIEASDREIPIVYGKENTTKEKKINFFKKESVSDFIESEDTQSAISKITTEGLTCSYVEDVFHCALDHDIKSGVNYEQEYLIAGKSSDEENLKYVVNRILLIRFCLNYTYLFSDAEKEAEAYALAAGIANVTSAIPGVLEVAKLLIMAAWAYGESIVDLRALLKGEKISILKNAENWQLSLSGLATLSATAKPQENGIGYQDYLKALLLLQSDRNQKYMRMMDVMEKRIKDTQPDFILSEQIVSFRLAIQTNLSSLFFKQTYPREYEQIYEYGTSSAVFNF